MKHYRFPDQIQGELAPLHQSNNYRSALGLAYDFLVIATAIYCGQFHWLLYFISIMVIGSRQRALASILHDASHGCLAKNKKVNYILGTYFSGYLIGQEFFNYVDSHVRGHHTFLGDKKKDPDYRFHLDLGLYSLKNEKQFLIKYVLKPLFLLNVLSYTYYVFKYRMAQFKKYPKQYMYMGLYWLVILSLFLYLGVLKFFLLFWIVPYFTSFMIVGWFIEMAEHYPLVDKYNNSLYMTRNRFSHWLEAFFLSIHAENYHLTHHLRPNIPYWNIAKAHNIMMKDPSYREMNSQVGGIFLSSNANPPMIKDFFIHKKLPIHSRLGKTTT